MKALKRFKQGGGFRLVTTLTRKGLLPDLIKVGFNVLFRRRSYQQQYSILTEKVKPLLMKEFKNVLDNSEKQTRGSKTENGILDEEKKHVWFCWLQGIDKAPDIVKSCLKSQKQWLKDKTFTIITADNYKEYISLPGFIEEKYARHIIPDAMFTDLIRVELLIKHGGTWIDSTVMITGNNYPKEILDCPIFMPQYISMEGSWHGISNWFITADRESHLLILLREMLYEYWRRYDCVLDYHVFHLFFNMIAYKYSDEIKKMPLLNSYHCIELLKHLGEDSQPERLERFLSRVSIHKLSYRLNKKIMENKANTLHDLLKLIN
jgi:hypothetical protein